jgi:hypothetical protein
MLSALPDAFFMQEIEIRYHPPGHGRTQVVTMTSSDHTQLARLPDTAIVQCEQAADDVLVASISERLLYSLACWPASGFWDIYTPNNERLLSSVRRPHDWEATQSALREAWLGRGEDVVLVRPALIQILLFSELR